MVSRPDNNMTALNPDWVMATGSNAHAARDRGWFNNYTPFTSYVQSVLGGDIGVAGVGDVDLPVKLYPKRSGARTHSILRLRNVLHIPTAICNIVGMPQFEDDFGEGDGFAKARLHGMGLSGDDGELTDDADRRVAYLHRSPMKRFWMVTLSGPPVGPVVAPSRLESQGMILSVSILWPESERLRWLATRGGTNRGGNNTNTSDNPNTRAGGGGNATTSASQSSDPPYTDEEKDWLKHNWDGEFKFLSSHGLSIYKEEDREEGRRIVRAAMHVGQVLAGETNDGESDDGDDYARVLRTCLGASQAGDFAEEELEFIENGWGSVADFMMVYGLKFYKDDDVEEAKAIVRALIADDEDDEDDEDGEEEL